MAAFALATLPMGPCEASALSPTMPASLLRGLEGGMGQGHAGATEALCGSLSTCIEQPGVTHSPNPAQSGPRGPGSWVPGTTRGGPADTCSTPRGLLTPAQGHTPSVRLHSAGGGP